MNKPILALIVLVVLAGVGLLVLDQKFYGPAAPDFPKADAPAQSGTDGKITPPAMATPPAPLTPSTAAADDPRLPPLPKDEDDKPHASASLTPPLPKLEAASQPPAKEQLNAVEAALTVASQQAASKPEELAPADAAQAQAKVEATPPKAEPAPAKAPEVAKASANADAKPESTKPAEAKPVPAKAENAKSEAGKAETAKTEPAKGDAAKQDKAPAAKGAAEQQRAITRFVVFSREKGATVRLVGTSPIRYASMPLSNPDRLVVDLDGQWQIKAPGVPGNPLVSNVRIGNAAGKTRVVIDLKEKPRNTRFTLSQDNLMLDVRVDQ